MKHYMAGFPHLKGIHYLSVKALLSIPFTLYFYLLYNKRRSCIKATTGDTTFYLILLLVITIYFVLPISKAPANTLSFTSNYAIAISTLLLVALEEYIFRGYLLNQLQEKFSANKAQIYSSATFAIAHIGNIITHQQAFTAINQILIAFGYGMVLSSLYIRYKSITICIILHFCINFLQEVVIADKKLTHPTFLVDNINLDIGFEIIFPIIVSAFLTLVSISILNSPHKST